MHRNRYSIVSPSSTLPLPPKKSTLLMRQKLALEPLNVEDYTSHVFRLYWQIVYPLPEEKNNPKANKQTKERKKEKNKLK